MNTVSLKTIQRFAERSKRWVMAYINGLTEEPMQRRRINHTGMTIGKFLCSVGLGVRVVVIGGEE